MQTVWNFLKGIVLWPHQRGTLPYDILCGVILVFIFLTPRSFWCDWPVFNDPHQFQLGEQIIYTLDEQGNPVLNISAQLVPPAQDPDLLRNSARNQLEKMLNHPVTISSIKPIVGEDGQTVGYSVWLQ